MSRYLFLVMRLEGLTTLRTKFCSTKAGAVWAAMPSASSAHSQNNPPEPESACDAPSSPDAVAGCTGAQPYPAPRPQPTRTVGPLDVLTA